MHGVRERQARRNGIRIKIRSRIRRRRRSRIGRARDVIG